MAIYSAVVQVPRRRKQDNSSNLFIDCGRIIICVGPLFLIFALKGVCLRSGWAYICLYLYLIISNLSDNIIYIF